MKFIKRIGDGEITIQDNQVVELTPSERADHWSKQFGGQAQAALADEWVGEFHAQQGQAASPPAGVSVDERSRVLHYVDSSLAEVVTSQ